MKLADIKIGDCVCLDGGFTCMKSGLQRVKGDERGLYIPCDDGRHYLDGQEDEEGAELVGISPAQQDAHVARWHLWSWHWEICREYAGI